MKKLAIIVLNMLNDMVYGGKPYPMPPEFHDEIMPRIIEFVAKAREKGLQIIYINDAHRPDDPEFTDFETSELGGRPHAVKGTEGAQVIPQLTPKETDIIVEKRRFSGFFNTPLDMILRKLNIETLVFVGRPTNVCVLYTAVDGFFHGYNIVLITDCLYAASKEFHESGLKEMIFARKMTSEDFWKEVEKIR